VVKGLSFGEITGPLSGPASDYNFSISEANTGYPCSNPPVFSVAAGLDNGTTYFGIVTLDSSNAVLGQLYQADLSSIPMGQSRVVIANATNQNLTAALKNHPGNQGTSVEIAASTIEEANPLSGKYEGLIYVKGVDTPQAGPISADLMSRDLYFYVLVGSASNNSVQIIGPKVIKDVF
jgi:hypothetical protein